MLKKTRRGVFKVRVETEDNDLILPALKLKIDVGTVIAETSDPIIKKGDKIVYDSQYINDLEDMEAFITSNVVHAKITKDGLIPYSDKVYIDTDKDKNIDIDMGDVKLKYPKLYKRFQTETVTQDGVIKFIGDHPELKSGDKVYTHHFLCDERNEKSITSLGKTYYAISNRDIYCTVRDGKIKMANGWNFALPVYEDESNYKTASGIILKPALEKEYLRCKIEHISEELAMQGVKEGDKAVFLPDRDYEMIVEGTVYYRIRSKDFIGTESWEKIES